MKSQKRSYMLVRATETNGKAPQPYSFHPEAERAFERHLAAMAEEGIDFIPLFSQPEDSLLLLNKQPQLPKQARQKKSRNFLEPIIRRFAIFKSK